MKITQPSTTGIYRARTCPSLTSWLSTNRTNKAYEVKVSQSRETPSHPQELTEDRKLDSLLAKPARNKLTHIMRQVPHTHRMARSFIRGPSITSSNPREYPLAIRHRCNYWAFADELSSVTARMPYSRLLSVYVLGYQTGTITNRSEKRIRSTRPGLIPG